MAPPILSVHGVTKRYGPRIALDKIDFEVPRGVIGGLLGHNGAGKSTLIGTILGQIIPDEGEVRISGHDVFRERAAALARVGAIFEAPVFYDDLSGARNLDLLTAYSDFAQQFEFPADAGRGRPVSKEQTSTISVLGDAAPSRRFGRITGPGKLLGNAAYSGRPNPSRRHEVVRFVGLERRIEDRVATYSHGMRRRLALAQALLPDPEFLLLDEPGDGLDPEGIEEMRELILRLHRERGMSILLSSHALAEVQQTCTHLFVLREGRLQFHGDWRRGSEQRPRLRVVVDRPSEAEEALTSAGMMYDFSPDGSGSLAANVTTDLVARWLIEHGFVLRALVPIETSVDQFYFDSPRQGRSG